MAILGQNFADLIDIYKQSDGNGGIVDVIEMLHEETPILDDAMAVECNKGTTHLHSIRTGLPKPTWGQLYKGTPQSKSQKASVEDTTGFVEAKSTIDKRLVTLGGDKAAAYRLSEGRSHLEGMAQEVSTKMFYGNSAADPDQFMGLAPRFNDPTAPNGKQIIDGGGTGNNNTSIWFVTWGDEQCHMIYPQGTKAGVEREDKGEQRLLDAEGNAYYGLEEEYRWHVGLAVKDWRYVSRIANLDMAEVRAGNVDLYELMRKAYFALRNRRPSASRNFSIYCNTDVLEALDRMGTGGGSGSNDKLRLKTMEIQGKEVETYRSFPIRETDSLINNEATIGGF